MAAAPRRLRLALAGVSLAAVSLARAAGQLDPTFANGESATLMALRSPSLAVSRDGRIALAATRYSGSFGQFKYGVVAMFDNAGQRYPAFITDATDSQSPPTVLTDRSADSVAFDLLGRLVASGASATSIYGAFTVRLRADGQRSTTYMNGGLGVAPLSGLGTAFAVAIDGKSRVVVGGSDSPSNFDPVNAHPVIVRLTADGVDDLSFGTGGYVRLPHHGAVRTLALDERGGIVCILGTAVAASETKVLMRLSEDGTVDTAFGSGGQTVVPGAVVAAGDARGRMLVIASRTDASPGSRLLRFEDGTPDASFGIGGEVLLPRAYNALTTASDGTVFAGMASTASQTATLHVLRVRNDGTIDTDYGSQGEAEASFDYAAGGGSSVPALAVDERGRLVVAAIRYHGERASEIQATTVMLYRFTSNAAEPPATGTAVEYHHATFDHYFVTSDSDEIAKLDADAASGWLRTGESFAVQTRSKGAVMPVCRFFSGAKFAPQSSHFYTPYPDECDTVDAGPAWKFEKLAFLLTLPVGAGNGNGTCPSGTVPLYRAFNAMKGGAPNHRYTTRASTLDAMIASGWIMEGEANTRVFACVRA